MDQEVMMYFLIGGIAVFLGAFLMYLVLSARMISRAQFQDLQERYTANKHEL